MRSKNQHLTNRGFTLIEIMVVLVIIAIVLSFAVLSIDTSSDKLKNEARRFAALASVASEETVMNSKEYRVVFNREGYDFFKFGGAGKWEKFEEGVLKSRKLPEGYSIFLSLEGEKISLAENEEGKEFFPAIYFLSSGEVTSFEVELINNEGEKYLVTNRKGEVEVLSET